MINVRDIIDKYKHYAPEGVNVMAVSKEFEKTWKESMDGPCGTFMFGLDYPREFKERLEWNSVLMRIDLSIVEIEKVIESVPVVLIPEDPAELIDSLREQYDLESASDESIIEFTLLHEIGHARHFIYELNEDTSKVTEEKRQFEFESSRVKEELAGKAHMGHISIMEANKRLHKELAKIYRNLPSEKAADTFATNVIRREKQEEVALTVI